MTGFCELVKLVVDQTWLMVVYYQHISMQQIYMSHFSYACKTEGENGMEFPT